MCLLGPAQLVRPQWLASRRSMPPRKGCFSVCRLRRRMCIPRVAVLTLWTCNNGTLCWSIRRLFTLWWRGLVQSSLPQRRCC